MCRPGSRAAEWRPWRWPSCHRGSCPCAALHWHPGPRGKPQARRPDSAWPSLGGEHGLPTGWPCGWGRCTHGNRRLASVLGRRAGTALLAHVGGPWAELPCVTPPHTPVCSRSVLGDRGCTLFKSSSHGETSCQASKLGPLQTPPNALPGGSDLLPFDGELARDSGQGSPVSAGVPVAGSELVPSMAQAPTPHCRLRG